jgi:hypothetical protein
MGERITEAIISAIGLSLLWDPWRMAGGQKTGPKDSGMGDWTKEATTSAMGLSFIPHYLIVGPLAMTILFLMFIWGLVRLPWSLSSCGPLPYTDRFLNI